MWHSTSRKGTETQSSRRISMTTRPGTTRACLALGLSAALLTLGVSCGKESSARRESVSADDVRGQPINAPAGTNTAASAGPTSETVAATRLEQPATTPAAPAAAHTAQERSNGPLVVGFDRLAS